MYHKACTAYQEQVSVHLVHKRLQKHIAHILELIYLTVKQLEHNEKMESYIY